MFVREKSRGEGKAGEAATELRQKKFRVKIKTEQRKHTEVGSNM